jgi:hypothetical protein
VSLKSNTCARSTLNDRFKLKKTIKAGKCFVRTVRGKMEAEKNSVIYMG